MLGKLIGGNPYRRGSGFVGLATRAAQMALGSAELALVLWLPPYRAWVRGRIRRPVDLMVFGAQKSGTTWLHAQFESLGLAAVSPLKECHHFDRGRMWSVRRYLAQFEPLPKGLPVVEVAPDYGPMAAWRVRAVKVLFPEMKLAFLARNPVDRAWSGTRMETAFDRGWKPSEVPVKDFVDHLRIGRSRRYGDYAGQIGTWAGIFGRDRLRVYPFEMVRDAPQALLSDLLEHVTGKAPDGIADTTPEVFPGEGVALPDAVLGTLERLYLPEIDRFAKALGDEAARPWWQGRIEAWHAAASALRLAPEAERNILIICGFAPNPNATSSGQKLAHRRIMELAGRFRSVRLIYFVNQIDALDPPPPAWPDNVTVGGALSVDTPTRLLGLVTQPRVPSFVSARRQAAGDLIATELRRPELTDFFADFAQGLAPVKAQDLALFAFRQHDIVSRLYERSANMAGGVKRFFYRLEAARTEAWQRQVWSEVLRMTTLSQVDAETVCKIAPAARVVADPVRGTFDIDASARGADTIVPGRIGFWGNMARGENVDAVCHMVKTLLPAIRDKVPSAHFWIIGAHPGAEVRALESEAVHVTGFVEDPAPVFATLDLAVAPLRLGSGVKIKVYETIDVGIPTVASPVGAEGIEASPCLFLAEDDTQFVKICVQLLLGNEASKGG